jgi:hypothetical protein
MEFCLFLSFSRPFCRCGPSYCAVGVPANASTVVVGISDGGREQQCQEGHWADPGSGMREGTHPETTVVGPHTVLLASLLMLVLLLLAYLTAVGNSNAKKDIGHERGMRVGTHPETTAAEGVLCASQQIEEAEWRCKVRATSHKLRKCEEFPEMSAAARLDLVREYDLCRLWQGCCGGKIKGKRCQLRNMIRKELCQE